MTDDLTHSNRRHQLRAKSDLSLRALSPTETTYAPECRRVQRCPEVSPVATAGGYYRLEHDLALWIKVLVRRGEVFTIGVDLRVCGLILVGVAA
jgi:hypothetical protein